jgi:hypothetical protein
MAMENHRLIDDVPLKPPFTGNFPLPCLITEGYFLQKRTESIPFHKWWKSYGRSQFCVHVSARMGRNSALSLTIPVSVHVHDVFNSTTCSAYIHIYKTHLRISPYLYIIYRQAVLSRAHYLVIKWMYNNMCVYINMCTCLSFNTTVPSRFKPWVRCRGISKPFRS